MAYDMYRYRQKVSPFVLAAAAVCALCTGDTVYALRAVCLVCFAFAMSVCACRNDVLETALLSEHDDAAERDMLALESTRHLLENQDNMILTATYAERNRIAREIHDSVGHMLTRSILQTGAISVVNQDERLKGPITQLKDTLDTAMNSMRTSVHDLHDESVDMKTAITDITSGITGFDVSLDYDMGIDIPKDVKYSFINITREAVNNAVKHSNGNILRIELREHPAFYRLAISDNGTDIHMNSDGMGLANIRERVRLLDGILEISTDKGFKILTTVMKK